MTFARRPSLAGHGCPHITRSRRAATVRTQVENSRAWSGTSIETGEIPPQGLNDGGVVGMMTPLLI